MTDELKPGDMAIIPSSSIYDRYVIVKIERQTSRSWFLRQWGRAWDAKEHDWSAVSRRNQTNFHRLPADADPAAIHAALKSAYDDLNARRREADRRYRDAVKRLAGEPQ